MSALGFATAIVRAVSWLVPADSRDEWVEEWCGELAWEHDDLLHQGEHPLTIFVALVTRLSGIVPDSLTLRFISLDTWPGEAVDALVELAHAPLRSALGLLLLALSVGLAAPVLVMSTAAMAMLGAQLDTRLVLLIIGAPSLLCGLGLPSAAVQAWRAIGPAPDAATPRHALVVRAAVVSTGTLIGASTLASLLVGQLGTVTFPGDPKPLFAGLSGAGGSLRLLATLGGLTVLQFVQLVRRPSLAPGG